MSRLFTFGCSFTNYGWPTWADILSYQFDQYENWGKVGGGNHFIFYRLIEAIERNNISKDDTVAIMWSSIGREDRFIKGKWELYGSVYNSKFTQDYIDNHTDPTGYYLTNTALIQAAKKILDGINCNYYFLSMAPLSMVDDSYLGLSFSLKKSIEEKCQSLYNESLELIKPSVYEVIFNNDWHSLDHIIIPSAQKNSLKDFEKRYNKYSGKDWPKFEDFIENNYAVSSSIQTELEDQFNFVQWRDNILTCRQDFHPTPLEHFVYLSKIGFNLTNEQEEFARVWDQKVLTDANAKYVKEFVKEKINSFGS